MKRQTVTTFALTLTTTTEDCIVGIALKCLYAGHADANNYIKALRIKIDTESFLI